MKKTILAAVLAALGVVAGACNNVGDCPSAFKPGDSCSGDNLSCPYTLQTPTAACDGTMVDGGVATSCVCQMGMWSCPSPVSCGDDGGQDAAPPEGDAGPDATVDAGSDAVASDGTGADTASDVAHDAAAEAAADVAADTAAEGAGEASTDATGN